MDQLDDILDQDIDPTETREWVDSLDAVISHDGTERAHFLLERMVDSTRRAGGYLPFDPTTEYVNTIAPANEAKMPGDAAMEWRIRSLIRWNAMAMVVRANRKPGDLGGHIASFASSATLYDVGFNHFWRAPSADHPGDLVFHQGHSSPGIYARSFLEGRITRRADGPVPHGSGRQGPRRCRPIRIPWLMPDYWQVPTVSMGLGPIQAIYQAQFWKYLEHRGLIPKSDRKIWCFLGDGETDEPESLGAISLAGREGLDNLIFVINCNLQRLDGPVRGNGKIIQELEGVFRGAGWNAIKLVWGSYWDPLLARDHKGVLRKLMMETVDGEYQACKAFGGAYTREHFFGKYPETREMVANLSDDDIWRLNRGGHDPHKVYAAYHAAVQHQGHADGDPGQDGQGLRHGRGRRVAEPDPPAEEAGRGGGDATSATASRFRFRDDKLKDVPYYHPGKDSPEVQYMLERRKALGGSLPQRRRKADAKLKAPELAAFEQITKGTGEREISTTMALVRGMNLLLRDKQLGERVVPIVADEARTFGMEGMFRQIGIYAPFGQKYTPAGCRPAAVLPRGPEGPGAAARHQRGRRHGAWMAAATSYSISNQAMLPFFIYYSMFGFQRIGDLCWAAGDMRARGFLIGGTAGRTTLNGEGLQHEDGHSHLMSGAIPNVKSYDPTFSYEVAVILQDGTRRMMAEQEDIYYYITVMNENYSHPDMPEGSEEGIIKGMYLFKDGGKPKKGEPRVQLLGSGTILREVIAAAELLEKDFGVKSDIWSCPSFIELRRDGFDAERWNRLHPEAEQRVPYVTGLLRGPPGSGDRRHRLRARVRRPDPRVHARRHALHGAGYRRLRPLAIPARNLREFFEVDRYWIAHAALAALAKEGKVNAKDVSRAIKEYKLDQDKPNPLTV